MVVEGTASPHGLRSGRIVPPGGPRARRHPVLEGPGPPGGPEGREPKRPSAPVARILHPARFLVSVWIGRTGETGPSVARAQHPLVGRAGRRGGSGEGGPGRPRIPGGRPVVETAGRSAVGMRYLAGIRQSHHPVRLAQNAPERNVGGPGRSIPEVENLRGAREPDLRTRNAHKRVQGTGPPVRSTVPGIPPRCARRQGAPSARRLSMPGRRGLPPPAAVPPKAPRARWLPPVT